MHKPKRKKYTYEEIKQYYSDHECELLTTSEGYKKGGVKVVVSYKCKCGRITSASVTSFQYSKHKKCPACANKLAKEALKPKVSKGERYGRLIVLKQVENNKWGRRQHLCKCDCGVEKVVADYHLRAGITKTCGTCKKTNSINLIGKKFGSLLILRQTGMSKHNEAIWECKCSCGMLTELPSRYLRTADYPNCGQEDCPEQLLEKKIFFNKMSKLALKRAKEVGGYCRNDLLNKRFGKIVVKKILDQKIRGGSVGCICHCDCGNDFVIGSHWLRRLGMIDCGCENARNETRFSCLERNLILGTLLGDGNLSKNSSSELARLGVNHSIKQSEFVDWKKRLLNRFVKTEPKNSPNTDGFGGILKQFRTISTEEMGELYNLLYINGKKTITEEFLSQIDHPIALATWYMDDGSCTQKSRSCLISTDSFSLEENELLCNWLKTKWGIVGAKPYFYKNKYYRLSLNAEARDKLFEIIQEYVNSIPSMQYKLTQKFRKKEKFGHF